MLARLLQAMAGDVDVTSVHFSHDQVASMKSGSLKISDLTVDNDLIFLNMHEKGLVLPLIERQIPSLAAKVRIWPSIDYVGFHPDVVYVRDGTGGFVTGPLGDYQSSIAFYAWLNDLNEADAIGLFSDRSYEMLGFYDYPLASAAVLSESEASTHISLGRLIPKWSASGCWMHSINHPKVFVLADLAEALLAREGITAIPNVLQYVHDFLADGPVFPVYPEIADRLGIVGQYIFKRDRRACSERHPVSFMKLDEFIHASFEAFGKYTRGELACPRLSSPRYQSLGDLPKKSATFGPVIHTPPSDVAPPSDGDSAAANHGGNPYNALADFHFWRRSIERLPMELVDPIVRVRFKLTREERVATAGSCFAQHISQTLRLRGFNFFTTEKDDHAVLATGSQSGNLEVFSARYGNLYTTRQLLQLFDRAYGNFVPQEIAWKLGPDRYVDPFRPHVEPRGFATVGQVQMARERHLAAVRSMFENLDVFIFTLGLTEAWRNRVDGAVYPLAPGVVGRNFDAGIHEFVNFDAAEVVCDMQSFIERLRGVNRAAKLILTVSPVPLIATYESSHVLVATTYSKSVLRVAAQEIFREDELTDYFPSFEIITGNHSRGAYFEKDLRSITAEGVRRVMSLFLKHYAAEPLNPSLHDEVMREHGELSEVICDEEAIDTRTH
jgi:hypothetical protein